MSEENSTHSKSSYICEFPSSDQLAGNPPQESQDLVTYLLSEKIFDNQDVLDSLVREANIYCRNNGISIVPESEDSPVPMPHTVVPRPIHLSTFETCVNSITTLNKLYDRIAQDSDFLIETLTPQATHDEFIGKLLELLKKVNSTQRVGQISYFFSRSDYIMHQIDSNYPDSLPQHLNIVSKQVEMNMISVGLANIASKVTNLHKYLTQSHMIPLISNSGVPLTKLRSTIGSTSKCSINEWKADPRCCDITCVSIDGTSTNCEIACNIECKGSCCVESSNTPSSSSSSCCPSKSVKMTKNDESSRSSQNEEMSHISPYSVVPDNYSMVHFGKGFSEAIKLWRSRNDRYHIPAYILCIVQEKETNTPDQRGIEYQLMHQQNLFVIRATLNEVEQYMTIDHNDRDQLYYKTTPIALVYYRSCYTPKDFTKETYWDVIFNIECSNAVKVPSVAHHLAGAKKIQQVLTDRDQLLRFISESEADSLLPLFMKQYTLDKDDEETKSLINSLKTNYDDYVLKPSREGGGNNIFGPDIYTTLEKADSKQRQVYILMEKIKPKTVKQLLDLRGKVVIGQTDTEFGVYGCYLRDEEGEHMNVYAGNLLRTKLSEFNEVGIMAGNGALDSYFVYE